MASPEDNERPPRGPHASRASGRRAPGDVVGGGRFRLESRLGSGGFGTTWAAFDQETGRRVAFKELDFQRTPDWKAVELFEREATVLAGLHHQAIPGYVAHGHVEEEGDVTLWLAQEVGAGRSLEAWVADGWRETEDGVQSIAEQVLEVLVYLHGLDPPVIHRDIKPENVLRDEDGRVMLVDFGSVRDRVRDALGGGSTVVGTFGYMAPEQFQGRALPVTDLYGLAVTVVYLLSHTDPSQLPHDGLRLDFADEIDVAPELTQWLTRCLEPEPEARYPSAAAALAALRGETAIAVRDADGTLVPAPAGSRVRIEETPDRMIVRIPAGGANVVAASRLGFSVLWTAFVAVWTSMAVGMGAPIPFTLFSIPFWLVGLGMMFVSLVAMARGARLELTRDGFEIHHKVLGIGRTVEGKTADLVRVKVGRKKRSRVRAGTRENALSLRGIGLVEGVRTHWVGDALTEVEQDWLAARVNDWLDRADARGRARGR